jgi:hypothetical protein
MHTRKIQYRPTGSAVTLGVVLALVLLIIGIAFFLITMLIGGQNETKNAVDSGMLNVGKQVLDDTSVPLYPTPSELIYIDVCNDATNGKSLLELLDGDINKKGQVTLRRVNRVWAKALQIAINAEAADREGHGGEGKSNAQLAFDGASSISDRLADKLADTKKLHGYFDDLAKRNSVRMLGTKANVKSLPGNNWQASFMDRERESNITVAPPEYTLPPNFKMPNLVMKSLRKQMPSGGKDLWFLPGYTPIKLADRTFWQIPFSYDQAPHLVSGREFDSSTQKAKPIGDWQKPIPNAFSGEGVVAVDSKNATQKATSWVLTNPGQPFKMCLPHSFVRIKLDDMLCHWYFFPLGPEADKIEHGDPTKYDFKEPQFQAGPKMPLGGPFCAYVQAGESVQIGLEVFARSLDEVIFAAPGEGNVTTEAYLLNRANEMIGKVGKVITKDELHDCLNNWITRGFLYAGQTEFYLFSADGETLEVLPKYLALARAPWLVLFEGNEPDGTEMKVVDDADCIATILNNVNAKPLPKCMLFPPPFGWGLWDKDVYWTPGSGYNSCLGNLRVKRWTEVYSVGIAIPNPV